MPTSFAIDLAVYAKSPVTILTVIPAFLHFAIAYLTYPLATSLNPNNPKKMRSPY